MNNIEQLVEQIVHSDNPQVAFNKFSKTLDDKWKTTLAREINKKLFLKNLDNSNLNQNIEFDLVQTPTLTKQASEQIQTTKSSLIEKIASYEFDEKAQIEKKASINSSMFKINNNDFVARNNFKSNSKSVGFITKQASEKSEKELTLKQIEINKQKELEKKAMLSDLKMARMECIEKIASLTNNSSEIRQIIKMIVGRGMEKVAEEVVNTSVIPSSEIEKVASVELNFDTIRQVNSELQNIKEIEGAIEKVAFVGPLFRPVMNFITGAGKYTGKGVLFGAKGAFNTAKHTGKFVTEHPVGVTAGVIGVGAGTNATERYKNGLTGIKV